MKLHIITVGSPKQPFAKLGWEQYLGRLQHYHAVHVTHIPDKHNTADYLLKAIAQSYSVGLVIQAPQLSSLQLAEFLATKALLGREISFIIGGPDGLPSGVTDQLDFSLSLSQLTFPHDLAMVVLLEALYRASSINAGTPYHH